MPRLKFKIARIPSSISRENLIERLKKLTDDYYNGNNGEQFYTYDQEMSNLEYMVKLLYEEGASLKRIIKEVVKDNYNQPHYEYDKCHVITLAFVF